MKFHFLTNERDNEAFTLVAEIFPEYNFEEIVDIHFNHLQKLSSFVRNNWSSTSDEEILNEEKVFDLRVAGKEVMKARMEGRSEDDFIFENESLNGRDANTDVGVVDLVNNKSFDESVCFEDGNKISSPDSEYHRLYHNLIHPEPLPKKRSVETLTTVQQEVFKKKKADHVLGDDTIHASNIMSKDNNGDRDDSPLRGY